MTASGRRIYIVDDDAEIVALMTALLESRGHRVQSNLVGAFAIPEIIEMRPHCVLLDLVMAQLDGYGMAAELKSRRELARTKIVMVSARSGAMWSEQARTAGLDGFIGKPIDIAAFAGQVEAFLDGGG
jgi:two-component system cell cycle response regulator DivK